MIGAIKDEATSVFPCSVNITIFNQLIFELIDYFLSRSAPYSAKLFRRYGLFDSLANIYCRK